jgi:uncharacterized protein (DUF2147 family)
MLFAAPVFAASPYGRWQTISDTDGQPRALVRLEPTANGGVRGVVLGSLRAEEDPNRVCDKCPGPRKGRKIAGMEILWGLSPVEGQPLLWRGGTVIDPDTGGVYSARLTLSPDGKSLTLRGYLGVAALGRSQTWRRAEGP